MIEQASFDFTAKPAKPVGEVERLVSYIYNRGNQWTSARQILEDLGINDRKLRILKGKSANRIISGPGGPGYRHIKFSTIDNLNEAAARKHSQIRAMVADYISLKKLAHSMIH